MFKHLLTCVLCKYFLHVLLCWGRNVESQWEGETSWRQERRVAARIPRQPTNLAGGRPPQVSYATTPTRPSWFCGCGCCVALDTCSSPSISCSWASSSTISPSLRAKRSSKIALVVAVGRYCFLLHLLYVVCEVCFPVALSSLAF